jgi:hypothetical protein
MDPVSHLCQRILPMLQGWAGRLKAEFPHVTARVSDLGSRGVALECTLPGVAADRPDRLALGVSLRCSDGRPVIQSAAVVWGPPSGRIEAETEPPRGDLTPERIEQIAERLPDLFAALRQAIRRGCPSA